MGVKSVRVYQAEDGSLHDNISDAYKHNAKHKAMQTVRNAVNKSSAGLLHIDVFSNPERAIELRNAMNKVLDYHRRYGKLKK